MKGNPERVSEVLAMVQDLLDNGKPNEVLDLIKQYGTGSTELVNAFGVALMRTGQGPKAAEVFRGLCLIPGSVCLRTDVPNVFKINYATALVLEKNPTGCLTLLDEIDEEDDPHVQSLRRVIRNWRKTLGWKARLAFACFGTNPDTEVKLDFVPGRLAARREHRPAA